MPAQQSQSAATVEADIEALLRQAEAADAAARATLTTPEEERAIIDAAETLAGSEAGVSLPASHAPRPRTEIMKPLK